MTPFASMAASCAARWSAKGANLGVTQLGRIEYARAGGRINTDFVDNSGGVDCSDHEVNIKILLDAVVGEGDLTTKQRNQLLVEMTDEVAALVLRDNYLQTQALSTMESEGFGGSRWARAADPAARTAGSARTARSSSSRMTRGSRNVPRSGGG